jgi:hypothetical protein
MMLFPNSLLWLPPMALPATVSAKEKPGWRPVLQGKPGWMANDGGSDDRSMAMEMDRSIV